MPAPVNLTCSKIPQGLLVSWDVVTDINSSCARSSIIHVVTVIGEANRTNISVEDTHIEITELLLESSQNYTINVKARLVQGTCETRESEAATAVCRTSGDPSPTTAPLTTGCHNLATILL